MIQEQMEEKSSEDTCCVTEVFRGFSQPLSADESHSGTFK
jgi:hypothetical protein